MNSTTKQARYEVLSRHAARLKSSITELEGFDSRYFWLRLSVIVSGLVGVVLIFLDGLLPLGVAILGISVLVFVIVVIFHRRLDHSLLRFKLSQQNTLTQLARMRLNWDQIPVPPSTSIYLNGEEDHVEKDHPFERDLEITGTRSIQHLLDTTITLGGSQRLRSWLLNTAPQIERIQYRQILNQEMKMLVGFRSRLTLSSAHVSQNVKERWSGEKIVNWLEQRGSDRSLWVFLLLLTFMSVANIMLFILNVIGTIPPYWVITLGLYGIIYNFKYRQYRHLFGDTYQLGRALEQFRVLFEYLEFYPYPPKGMLKSLCKPFWASTQPPSKSFKQIGLLISAASLKNNPILWIFFNAIMPWDMFFTYRFQQFTSQLRELLPEWLDAWYELEALNALANYAYLNPDYVLPELLLQTDQVANGVFETKSLGHPLLLDDVRICNDFSFDQLGQIVIISGSNMSGKSTFLKTLGVNLCLAHAGAPVTSTHMRTTLFRLFTSINVSDSLMDGISYFYAEVKRLKSLLEAYQEKQDLPLFFLIDEIFRGTNNRERQIGSQAYVRALVSGNGVGVISTHDLALVHLADDQLEISNYHFREDVFDNRMVFDYCLWTGPCPTTNALKIMSIEGLPVGE
ncbi:MAG: hypothetical protein U9R58_07315 [Chloroflexota bacterium]|nr:hypothetical protein [Chloroflexota bacterium]